MPALCFSSDDGSFCQVSVARKRLAPSIAAQLEDKQSAWCCIQGLAFDEQNSDLPHPGSQPLFFEWQRVEWLFEPAKDKVYRHPTFYDLPDDVKHM